MWRFGFDAISAYLLVVALLTLLIAVLVWQRHRTQKTIAVWFWAALIGIVLGSAGSYAFLALKGYTVQKLPPEADMAFLADGGGGEESPDMGGGMPGMGGEGRGGGGGGMPGGGGGGPRPKRDLTTLVQKIDLLTGDIALAISDEQAASLTVALAGIDEAETMSDDEAQAKHDAIVALLDDTQKARLDAVGIPRQRGSGGPGGGGRGAGGPGGGPEAERPAPDANPFRDEAIASALDHLRQRFGKSEAPK
jgi:hypothetical protein